MKLLDENEISFPLNIKKRFSKKLRFEQVRAKRDFDVKGNANKSKVVFDVMKLEFCTRFCWNFAVKLRLTTKFYIVGNNSILLNNRNFIKIVDFSGQA